MFILKKLKMNLFENINYDGLLMGLVAFFMIGFFHPIVIKVEYYFGKKVWPLFVLMGIISIIISVFFTNNYLSVIFGVLGFSLIWSAGELIQQHKRVMLGRAKKNPKRDYN